MRKVITSILQNSQNQLISARVSHQMFIHIIEIMHYAYIKQAFFAIRHNIS